MAPKKKQEKMNLGEFLTNQSLGSWADEMETQPMPAAPSGGYSRDREGGERRGFTQPAWESARSGSGFGGGMGGGMGMGDRGASFGTTPTNTLELSQPRTNGYTDRPRFGDREQLPFPTKPPYTAHLGNLTYDVTTPEIEDFLKECQVTNVRIVEDKLDHKPKGFGYVEFATPEGLKKALTYSETNFMGRNVKISIAEPPKDRGGDSSRDFSDWSRKGPLPDLPQNQRQGSNRGLPTRSFNDNASDAGSERGGGRKGFFEGDGKVRDFSDWSRKGPLSPVPGAGPPVRDGGRVREGPTERSPASWGEGRSDAGSRPPRREFEPRPSVERVPTAAETNNQWRSSMKPDTPPVSTPEASAGPSSPAAPAPPKERPRLNLTKRTVSTAEGEQATSSATDSKASPFGAARPVDTATKEREAEEKRLMNMKQKQEAEAKAREDKVAREAAARTARAERADRGQAQEDDTKVTSPTSESGKGRRASRQQNGTKPAPKENGETPAAQKPSFSILQRDTEGGDEGTEAAEQDDDANGSIVHDKETKPQEPVVENPSNAGDASDPTAQELEEEGWSTVSSAKPKTGRRTGGGRALAS
ncbi:Eukaryotic translation initiation factor 4B [Saxophila tyrrhenica]|uniref:Eukaryotic translation initiation factor 4B n=1 Tax=Saxophila tyrrhenica TaxID=1690608 RepID=A0AAV9P6G3_9PEZI|nr:Eukaryotic translation initiation factor 4B [Saxophila tyrrhenica]